MADPGRFASVCAVLSGSGAGCAAVFEATAGRGSCTARLPRAFTLACMQKHVMLSLTLHVPLLLLRMKRQHSGPKKVSQSCPDHIPCSEIIGYPRRG